MAASHSTWVGPAISYAIGQGAIMATAAWGIFVWREFRNASRTVRILLTLMSPFLDWAHDDCLGTENSFLESNENEIYTCRRKYQYRFGCS